MWSGVVGMVVLDVVIRVVLGVVWFVWVVGLPLCSCPAFVLVLCSVRVRDSGLLG